MNDTYVTIQGRLVADPVVRHTTTGTSVAAFRLASSARRPVPGQPGKWVDSPPSFYSISAWRALGANAVGSLKKGDPVTIHGRQRVVSYQRGDGSWGSSVEIDASSIGHDLTFGTTVFSKVTRAVFDDGDRLNEISHQLREESFSERAAEPGPGFGDPEQVEYELEPPYPGDPEELSDRGPGEEQTSSGPLVPLDEDTAA